VPCAVRVYVFVFMEVDFEVPAERVGDTAERFQAGDMIAAFQTRNHRLSHSKPSRQLLLRLTGMVTQLQQLLRALRSKRGRLILDDARPSVYDVP